MTPLPEELVAIEEALEELREVNTFGEDEEGYLCAKALLYGLVVGTNPDKVAKHTKISRLKVRTWFTQLRANGVIKGKIFDAEWCDDSENGVMCLILDVLVAQGQLRRQQG